MASRTPTDDGNILSIVAESAGKAIGGELGALAGKAAVEIGSELTDVVIRYWFAGETVYTERFVQELKRERDGDLPPFMIIGLGRCGSHVTSMLAQVVAKRAQAAAEHDPEGKSGPKRKNFSIRNFFSLSGSNAKPIISIEPMMVVGDIDESTFSDIDELLKSSPGGISERVMVIDYDPLARGGVGHVPIFAEFLTRCLLSAPPAKKEKSLTSNREDQPKFTRWEKARTFLIDSTDTIGGQFRLANYVFSAAGGTGCGAASEILRAQRIALLKAGIAASRIYFNGVAVMPHRSKLGSDKTYARNCGRLFVQYLSELNIDLSDARSFEEAPKPRYSTYVTAKGSKEKVPVGPWNAMAVVSNDLMVADGRDSNFVKFEDAERNANQYIAQQLFNISSAQLPVSPEFKYEDFNEGYFSSIRLDPEDLATGLVGPYAIGYAESSTDSFGKSDDWIEQLFCSAISLPQISADDQKSKYSEPIVQGISVSPLSPDKYTELTLPLQRLTDSEGISWDKLESALQKLGEIPFFEKCPRAIVVFTAPPDATVPANISTKLEEMTGALLPNISQTRLAIIRGTTANYTLSIFFESSVVLASDVFTTIKSYLWLCWSNRNLSMKEFDQRFTQLFEEQRIICDADLADWIEEREDLGRIVAGFDQHVGKHERAWRSYLDAITDSNELDAKGLEDRAVLDGMKVEHHCLNRNQLIAALNYVMYVKHYKDIGIFGLDD